MQLPSLLARRYLATRYLPRAMRIIIMLCYIGITIGACSLMLALMITRGFEKEIGAKLQGINADAVVYAHGHQLDVASLRQHIGNWFGPFIKGMSGSCIRHLLLEHNNQHHVLFVKGINPTDEQATTSLATKVVSPKNSTLVPLLLPKNNLVIGSELAKQLHLKIGDVVALQVPEPSGRKMSLSRREVTVAGIFHLGLDEYDSHAAFSSLETIESFYHEPFKGVDRLSLSFTMPSYAHLPWWQRLPIQLRDWWLGEEGIRARHLRALKYVLSGLTVRGWQELYPDLVASLALEKYAITIVLALIALVASMLIICLLFMLIQYKQRDIAILRAMGTPFWAIHRLFHLIGLSIALRSVSVGLTIAWVIGWWLQTYKMVRLPDAYYLSYLPASLEPFGFIMIFLLTMLLATIACRIPLRQLKKLDISDVLRG